MHKAPITHCAAAINQKVQYFLGNSNSDCNKMHRIPIKGINLRNMSIGDGKAVELDKIGELTLLHTMVKHSKMLQKYHGSFFRGSFFRD